ncbi:MAG: ACT domain-containing protein [Candidatus Sifarchaeia archaeon]
MSGENNLKILLREMKPVVVDEEYVFCTIPEEQLKGLHKPLLVFREHEGLTVIVTKDIAVQNGFSFFSTWGLISLSIHSDLEAVGFLAAITEHLASAGISVNTVSAFYHDHLFVPYDKLDEAFSLLSELSKQHL